MRRLLTLLLFPALLLGACGDDDDTTADDPTEVDDGDIEDGGTFDLGDNELVVASTGERTEVFSCLIVPFEARGVVDYGLVRASDGTESGGVVIDYGAGDFPVVLDFSWVPAESDPIVFVESLGGRSDEGFVTMEVLGTSKGEELNVSFRVQTEPPGCAGALGDGELDEDLDEVSDEDFDDPLTTPEGLGYYLLEDEFDPHVVQIATGCTPVVASGVAYKFTGDDGSSIVLATKGGSGTVEYFPPDFDEAMADGTVSVTVGDPYDRAEGILSGDGETQLGFRTEFDGTADYPMCGDA